MTLNFVLLVIDDNPGPTGEALKTLREHLERLGFDLEVYMHSRDFSDPTLTRLSRAEGRNYDLVMIDYRLDPAGQDGAAVARRLRTELPYTDMVFYSSDPAASLLRELANQQVDGVFVARRQELADSLTGLADTIIRKTVDLTHMRGIAMAEVAEMDTLLQETLARALGSGLSLPRDAGTAAATKLRKSMRKDMDRLEQRVQAGQLDQVVATGRLFGLERKLHLLLKIAKKLPGPPAELTVLATFKADIIDRRNMLAHVKETPPNEEGVKVLRIVQSGTDDVIIDDEWMKELRLLLKKHKPALAALCNALDGQVDQAVAGDEAQ